MNVDYRLNKIKWEILKSKKKMGASKTNIDFCKKFTGFLSCKSLILQKTT